MGSKFVSYSTPKHQLLEDVPSGHTHYSWVMPDINVMAHSLAIGRRHSPLSSNPLWVLFRQELEKFLIQKGK